MKLLYLKQTNACINVILLYLPQTPTRPGFGPHWPVTKQHCKLYKETVWYAGVWYVEPLTTLQGRIYVG